MSKTHNWTHPAHRPLRAARCDFGTVGGQLTDARITAYILEGRYGEEARLRELARQTEKEQKKKSRSSSSRSAISSALKLLGL